MTLPLLSTKLRIPPRQRALVPRPRLLSRLEEGLAARLILVSAPAGFGKTTLLAQWLHAREAESPLRVAWLSLDHGDDDAARFLAYLVAALQTLEPRLAEGLLAAQRSPERPPVESLLAVLVNDVAALLGRDRCLLVLDDYHAVQDPAIHDILFFLLEHLPPAVGLVVAGRADPPIPLARLRGQGQLVELRDADLRFTPGEAAFFLNQVMGLALSAADVAALEARTEGWITGLQLAALSLRGRDSAQIPAFVQGFAGSHRFVLDYLVEEVLAGQPPGIQAFLLQTSILERLCGGLCEAVVGNKELANWGLGSWVGVRGVEGDASSTDGVVTGQDVLDYLEANHLFILPLDDERRWYRYHRLFADLLRARLPNLGPGLGLPPPAELHRRASAWYEAGGQTGEAIAHALAAGEGARAAGLVAGAGLNLLVRGELTTLLGWLGMLPDDLVRASQWLCLYHAWALALSGRSGAAEARLQDAEACQQDSGTGDAGGHAAAIRAYMAAHAGDAAAAVDLARRSLELLPEGERTVRSVVAFTLANVHRVQGDTEAAARALIEAADMGQEGGNLHLAVSALCQLGALEMERGHLHSAARYFCRSSELAGDLPVAASSYSGLGALAYEWNDLPAAEKYLARALELHRRWGNTEALVADYGEVLRLRLAQDDLAGAEAVLEEMARVASGGHPGPPSPFLATSSEICRVYLALARGDQATAARWAAGTEALPHSGPGLAYLHEFRDLTVARVHLALGRGQGGSLARAERLLSRLLAEAEAQERWGRAIEALALLALVRQAEGDLGPALDLLQRALVLAEPEGYVRSFVDAGAPLAELLRLLSGRGDLGGYPRRLLVAFPEGVPDLPPPEREVLPSSTGPMPWDTEPLSERELEVLRLVAAGLTNAEIAGRLFIAVSTVKSHTNSIYGKLGVKNRTQAVGRAQEMGFL